MRDIRAFCLSCTTPEMNGPIVLAARWCSAIWRATREDDGQDLMEYGILMALIAIVAMGSVSFFGNTINNVFWQTIAANF